MAGSVWVVLKRLDLDKQSPSSTTSPVSFFWAHLQLYRTLEHLMAKWIIHYLPYIWASPHRCACRISNQNEIMSSLNLGLQHPIPSSHSMPFYGFFPTKTSTAKNVFCRSSCPSLLTLGSGATVVVVGNFIISFLFYIRPIVSQLWSI